MVLIDILSREVCEKLEGEVFDRYGINCTVFDIFGTGVTGKPHWCNRLCPEIKTNQEALAAICAPGNQNFMARVKQTRKPVVGECDAGFIKIAVPIIYNGEFMGTAGGCGLLPVGGKIETFLIGKTMGMSEKQIHDRCDGLRTMTQETAEKMALFLKKRLSQYIDDPNKQSSASTKNGRPAVTVHTLHGAAG